MAGGDPTNRQESAGSAADADAVDRRAIEIARTLVEAYHLQDEREHYLRRNEPRRAEAVAASARQQMAAVWEAEFPSVPTERARTAGEEFVRALFVQDEIENWTAIRQHAGELDGVLECPPPVAEPESIESDPRWSAVESKLTDACEQVGIDEEYASLQTRFWRLHGTGDDEWTDVAREAHGVKLDAMLAEASSLTDRLGDHFVDGVAMHDRWTRDDPSGLSETVQHVATYYRELFATRGNATA